MATRGGLPAPYSALGPRFNLELFYRTQGSLEVLNQAAQQVQQQPAFRPQAPQPESAQRRAQPDDDQLSVSSDADINVDSMDDDDSMAADLSARLGGKEQPNAADNKDQPGEPSNKQSSSKKAGHLVKPPYSYIGESFT